MSKLNETSSDFLKVLLALKTNIMKDLHVATLGRFVRMNGSRAICRPFPLINGEQEKTIECLVMNNVDLDTSNLVVILYLDRNSIKALNQAQSNQSISQINESSELHSEKYGIIIGTVPQSV